MSAVVLVALVPAVARYLSTEYVSNDTPQLVQDVRVIFDDVQQGQWHDWGGHFALLQQIPTAALVYAGLSDQDVYRALVVLNLIAFGAVTWWCWTELRKRSKVVGALFVAVLLSGPTLWYGHGTWSEMLALAITLGLVISLLRRAHGFWVFLIYVGAAISKDTALPFVLLLSLGSALVASEEGQPVGHRLRLTPIAIATLLALALMVGFNFIRFGSPLSNYFNPVAVVPSLAIQANFFLAIWLSPNGGVILFWPSFTLFLILVMLAATLDIRASQTPDARRHSAIPLLTAGTVLGGVTLGLSRWVAPLGWITWGPRLILPWLPAASYLLAAAHAGRAEALLDSRRRRLFAVATVAVLAFVSLPQYLILFRQTLLDPLFIPDAVCPRMPFVQEGATYYYSCTEYQLWSKHSILLDAYHPNFGPDSFVLASLCGAALLWFAGHMLLTGSHRLSSVYGRGR